MKRRAGLIFFAVILCVLSADAFAADWQGMFDYALNTAPAYAKKLIDYEGLPEAPAGARVALPSDRAKLAGDSGLENNLNGRSGAALRLGPGGSFEWQINVDQAGLYELEIEYLNLPGNDAKIQLKLTIDGESPFEEANNLCLYRYYVETEIGRRNSIGDEVWPRQTEVLTWQVVRAADGQGIHTDPLRFYLSEGGHVLQLSYVDQPVAIGDIAFVAPRHYDSYQTVKAGYAQKGYAPAPEETFIKLQAENSLWRSESVVRRESDADPKTEPRSGAARVLNTVGGYRWRLGNSSVTWELDVPVDGLYSIHLKVAQTTDPGMPSYRQILLDGEIPFEEMKLYAFPYQERWYVETLKDDQGVPYQFYLTKGKHTLTAVVKLGTLGEIMNRTKTDVQYLGALQREIMKITGSNPDYNFEYDLYRTMPELGGQLAFLSRRLKENADKLASVSNKTTTMENNFRQIIDQLNFFAGDVDRIPKALSDLDNALTSLGTSISTIEKCPLTVDYLTLTSPASTYEAASSTFLARMAVTGENFLASFTKDYDSVGMITDESGTEHTVLDVWMARGTEWGEILKEMADEDFTPKTGIVINLHVLPGGQLSTGSANTIMLSIASQTAPDVAISVEYNLPAELAFRDATVDLSQFGDLEQVTSQFYESSLVPYSYQGGVYALPETMDFTCMVYRQDILSELGLRLPETWDELYHQVLPILYENNMSFALPVDTSVSSNSPGALRGFTMLLLQLKGDYYHNGGASSALDSPEAYKAFKMWTDMYANYGIDAESNFFTRLRLGNMPIGIGNFTTYMQLLTSAPELYGRWGIAPVPGIRQADGTVSHAVGTTASTASMILSQSDKQEEAWEFLKWWLSEDTQTKYGRELEAVFGLGARWNTANINAFFSMPWDARHTGVMRAQMAASMEQPIVPGGYFTGRHIINAWNRVCVNNENARDSLEKAVKDINKELANKRQEFGLE